jgi:CBS-domain-containing membrane protein
MTQDPKVCLPDDYITAAVDIMWNHDCGSVPVVRDLESRELVGIITDRDIAMHVVRHAFVHPSQAKVKDCMSSPAVSCKSTSFVKTAAKLMGEHQIRRIPVVDKTGRCVGTISQADLLSRVGDVDLIIDVLRHVSVPHGKSQEVAERSVAMAKTPAAKRREKASDRRADAQDSPAGEKNNGTSRDAEGNIPM